MKNQKTNFSTDKYDEASSFLQRPHRVIKRKEKKTGGWVEIDADLCKECGLCVEACPVKVLRISENLNIMGYHSVEYIGSGCTGCGICFYVCPEPGTIRVYKKVRDSKTTFMEK